MLLLERQLLLELLVVALELVNVGTLSPQDRLALLAVRLAVALDNAVLLSQLDDLLLLRHGRLDERGTRAVASK